MAADIDYYDIMIIGRTGMGKSTTADKLVIANSGDLACDEHRDEVIEEGQVKIGDLGIWLISDAEGETERVRRRLKGLNEHRRTLQPHEYVNQVYNKKSEMTTSTSQLISNETTKVRVLDVPGFFGEDIDAEQEQETGAKVTKTGLSIMRQILRIQSTMRMKFNRIIYFIPERGPLERSHKVLQMELEQMVHYFGKSIFECMVLVATVNPDVYQYIPPEIIPFSEEAKQTTRGKFQAALMKVLPTGETIPDDKPPIAFISMNDSCEDIMKKIQDAPVICEELNLAFDHRTCIRCGLKAKILRSKDGAKRVACYAGEDPSKAMPYEESHCHPLIISKYWTIVKIVGGIAHFVTRGQFKGWWPDFRNPDDEICIECGRVPGDRNGGCTKLGSRFKLEGEEYKVDHSPRERVVFANRDQQGGIAMNLHEDDVTDEHRSREQQPELAESMEGEHAGEQQLQLEDGPGQVPAVQSQPQEIAS
jgi:hypothetical protein